MLSYLLCRSVAVIARAKRRCLPVICNAYQLSMETLKFIIITNQSWSAPNVLLMCKQTAVYDPVTCHLAIFGGAGVCRVFVHDPNEKEPS